MLFRSADMGYEMEVTTPAKDFIVEKGWDAQFGARPLKRAIQKYIEDALAEEIIKSRLHEGDRILIDYEENAPELKISILNPEIEAELPKEG